MENDPLLSISSGAIALIYEEIINNNSNEIIRLLKILDLAQADRKLTDTFFVMMMTNAFDYNRIAVIKAIISFWKTLYPSEDEMKVFLDFFANRLLPNYILEYINKNNIFTFFGVTYESLIQLLMNSQDENGVFIADRAYDVFNPDLESLVKFRNIAMVNENAYLLNYFNNLVSLKSKYRKIPEWISSEWSKDFTRDLRTQEYGVLKRSSENFELFVAYLPPDPVIDFNKYNKQELIKNELEINNAPQDTEIDYKTLVYKQVFIVEEKRQDNIELFQLYGPANSRINPTVEEMRYGGIRMFLQLDEVDGDFVEWFRGSCDFCCLKIRRRWHSLRLPLFGGGWKGCYCSFKCMRRSLNTPEHFGDGDRIDLVSNLMLDQIEVDIKEIGIKDWRDNGDIVKLYYDEVN